MDEILLTAHSVVYGQTIQHLSGDGKGTINAKFDVLCIIKQGSNTVIGASIIIEKIAPRDYCSGTSENMQLGNEAIVAIRPTANGNFEFDEVMPLTSATFPATLDNLLAVSAACDLQSWAPPNGTSINRCPICGASNFTDNVMSQAQSTMCSSTGFFGSLNKSLCEAEMESQAQHCIATEFTYICTRLVFTVDAVNCTCYKDSNKRFNEVDGTSMLLPSLTITMATMLFAVAFYAE